MLQLAKYTQRSVPKLAAATGTPQLMTIPISHYVDMARLSLEIAGIEYNELAYAPLQHVLPVLNLRCASVIAGSSLCCLRWRLQVGTRAR